MESEKIGTSTFVLLGIGAALAVILPIALAIVWKVRKKEPFTTILAGAATFLLFALVLEKPIQNVLLFPTEMGLSDHAVSRFVNARPLLLSLLAGLFPGVFEETGRLIVYKTVLKNRRNRETAVSHGIGHGGFEVILMAGITYVSYIAIAAMIDSGTFSTIVSQAAAQMPDRVGALYEQAAAIAGLTAADLGLGLLERVFSVLFHIGASILVFYAVKDSRRRRLYPLAIVLHTAMDFAAALYLFKVVDIPLWGVEVSAAAIGILTFSLACLLLYRRDAAGAPGE